MRPGVIVDLGARDQELVVQEFAVPIFLRELLMAPYRSRSDLVDRIWNFTRLASPPNNIWIAPNSRMKSSDVSPIRQAFPSARVIRTGNIEELRSQLKATCCCRAGVVLTKDMEEKLKGKPIVIVCEQRQVGLVEACKKGLQLTAPELTVTFAVQAGVKRDEWRAELRKTLVAAGGIVYVAGENLGPPNLPELSAMNLPAWKGEGVIGAMRVLYREISGPVDVCNSDNEGQQPGPQSQSEENL